MSLRQLPSNEITIQGPAAAAEELPALDLGDLIRLTRTHKFTILGTAVLTMAITALLLSYMTPIYSATSYVILDQRPNTVVDANAVVTGLPTDPVSIETQVQVLQSRNLAGRVVDELALQDDADFNAPSDDPLSRVTAWFRSLEWFKSDAPTADSPPALTLRDKIINKLLANLGIAAQGRSASIAIKFQWVDAAKSAQIANAFAEAYVEDQLAVKSAAANRASQWLSERLQQLSAQTQTSERAVEEYKAKSKLTDTANGASVLQQQLSALNTQLITAQADLAEQEAKYSQVTTMKNSGRAADISQAVSSSLISQLRQQEAELLRQEAELSSRYGPLHPKMIDLESQKKNLAAKIDEEVNRIVETVRNDMEVARARVSSLQKSLAVLTGQLDSENLARVKLDELASAATSNRGLYEAFLGRFKEIEGRGEVQVPDARVSSPATVPQSPSFPNKIVFLGAALPGGLLLGFLLAMISRSLEAGFMTRPQVENFLSLPVLAAVPEMPWMSRGGGIPAEKVVVKPSSSFAESMRALQIGLALGKGASKPPKIVTVTSSVPSEGKTTVAVSLARIAARSGKRVIVLDADLRRPRIHKAMNAERPECGIADLLAGTKTLRDCVCKDPISQAYFLTSARPFVNASELLASPQMASLIEGLSQACDLLIIDSPPVLPVNDARILAPMSDAVILAVQWRRTTREAAFQAARLLTDVMAPLAGIVLTRADEEQFLSDSYGGQRYKQFRKYYRE